LSFLSLRKKITFWIMLSYSTSLLILDAYVFPNLGTLYRMRYVFIMTFVALSIGGIIKYLQEKFSDKPI
jgi:hypothetical protein